ncbi:MAG: hypothetical protein P8P36_06690 [Akkermansiaceae bacterium]|nr:hypothetical protein [Akkermansiaceae bacterium]
MDAKPPTSADTVITHMVTHGIAKAEAAMSPAQHHPGITQIAIKATNAPINIAIMTKKKTAAEVTMIARRRSPRKANPTAVAMLPSQSQPTKPSFHPRNHHPRNHRCKNDYQNEHLAVRENPKSPQHATR